MDMLTAIQNRRSVRTFSGAALREDDAQKIIEYAARAGNPYGLHITWKLLNAKESGLSCPVIVGTDTYIGGKLQRGPHAEEAFGYAFEKTVLFAWTAGVGTTWIAGTMDRAAFEKAMEKTADEIMPCVSPLGYTAEKMSLRESVMRKGVKADTRLPFEELFFQGNFDTPLSPDGAGNLKEALQAVRLAPSAVNKQPWRAVVCGDKVHFYIQKKRPASGEWDVQRVDMGIALCHFELGAEAAGIKARFELSDPRLPAPEGAAYIASYAIG